MSLDISSGIFLQYLHPLCEWLHTISSWVIDSWTLELSAPGWSMWQRPEELQPLVTVALGNYQAVAIIIDSCEGHLPILLVPNSSGSLLYNWGDEKRIASNSLKFPWNGWIEFWIWFDLIWFKENTRIFLASSRLWIKIYTHYFS